MLSMQETFESREYKHKFKNTRTKAKHLVQLHIKVIFLFLNESRRFLLHIKKTMYKRYNLG